MTKQVYEDNKSGCIPYVFPAGSCGEFILDSDYKVLGYCLMAVCRATCSASGHLLSDGNGNKALR